MDVSKSPVKLCIIYCYLQDLYVLGMAMSEGRSACMLTSGYYAKSMRSSAVLAYRLWIICNMEKKLAYGLPTVLLLVCVGSLVVTTRFVDSMTCK